MELKGGGLRRFVRSIGATAIAGVLVLGAAGAAHANPTPNAGSEAGGDVVTLPVPSVTFTQLSGGQSFSLALGSDGNAYAWGSNGSGRLGDNTTTAKSTPVQVHAPAGVKFAHVSAGMEHSVGLTTTGQIYAWGNNFTGQLGDGTFTNRRIPTLVQAPGVVFTQVEASGHFVVALDSNGNAWAWGQNDRGQLGNGTTTTYNVPTMVQAPAPGVGFTQIATGFNYVVAIGSDGVTYAWGAGNSSQLADGLLTDRAFPGPVQMPPGGVTYTQVKAANYAALALGSDGNLWGWGNNLNGLLGTGDVAVQYDTPQMLQTPAGVRFTSYSLTAGHTLAIGTDGNTYAVGTNTAGGLGDGTTIRQPLPIRVHTPPGVQFTQVATGEHFSLAIASDGKIYGWGLNTSGQLGNGTTTNSSLPLPLSPMVAAVTSVSFDGVAGTGLTDNLDGTVSVTTPAHAAGAIDVAVDWTLNGVAQTPITYPAAFTFMADAAPVIVTQPSDQGTTVGGTATFTVAVSGWPTPTAAWEFSTDGGTTWQPIAGDPAAVVSGDSLSLAVTPPTLGHNGRQYRAVISNTIDTVTTSAANLVVIPGGGGGGGGTADKGSSLAVTGSDTPMLWAGAGTLLLMLGAGAVIVARRARQRSAAGAVE